MKKFPLKDLGWRLVFLSALLASIATAIIAESGEPRIPNLSSVKAMIKDYKDSGKWEGDINGITDQAIRYLDSKVGSKDQKYAVVLDVDDTSLSSYPYELPHDFGYVSSEWLAWANKSDAPPIPGTLKLYKHAKEKGVAVFFVTGRASTLKEATLKNLEGAGYVGCDGIYTKPDGYVDPSIVPYKSAIRAHIEAEGYRIVVNMGDQDSDLEGGHADRTFKLPNPMYLIK